MELNQSTLPQYLKVLTDKGVIFEKTPSYLVRNGIVGDSAVDMATVANGGIPAAAAQIIDPMIIKQLFAPTVATQLYPEVKKRQLGGAGCPVPAHRRRVRNRCL